MSETALRSNSALDESHQNISMTTAKTPVRDDYEIHRSDVAKRALQLLVLNNQNPNDDFCHMVEQYRRQTGTFPLPLESLPCHDCEKRLGGK